MHFLFTSLMHGPPLTRTLILFAQRSYLSDLVYIGYHIHIICTTIIPFTPGITQDTKCTLLHRNHTSQTRFTEDTKCTLLHNDNPVHTWYAGYEFHTIFFHTPRYSGSHHVYTVSCPSWALSWMPCWDVS
jgi:hypothetical protein